MDRRPVVIVGAGFGGLAAAVELARRGQRVLVLERERVPGGKARAVEVAGRPIDVGPTVLTMRWVFDAMFAAAGRRFDEAARLDACDVVARHAFADGSRLDLFADLERGVAAVRDFAGPREAEAYRRFDAHGAAIAEIVKEPFLEGDRPSIGSLAYGTKRLGLSALATIDAHRTMARAIDATFADARLRALFKRYATYVGSSPYEAPATLNLVAHVERQGVAVPRDGMSGLAAAVADLATSLGAEIRYQTRVREVVVEGGRATAVVVESATEHGGRAREVIEAAAVIANADVSTIASGALGDDVRDAVSAVRPGRRSLSALTWAIVGKTRGFPLAHHNVFFSSDYAREHAALFGRSPRVPEEGTVYVCAADRGASASASSPLRAGDARARAAGDTDHEEERLFVIVNAPATADTAPLTRDEVERCERAMFSLLSKAGLEITPKAMAVTTPTLFERLAPGTGGAIYGEASHGALSALSRPSSRTKLSGFYVAGGSVHPGAGVPMAALSGRTAARTALSELASTVKSLTAVMVGSTSMP